MDANDTKTNDTRNNYLIQWRQGLWAQIRQKEDAIWRFISFYAGAIILVAGFVESKNPAGPPSVSTQGALLIIMTLLVVTIWGILVVLDANFWMQRNLLFVGNIEREILPHSDIGVLLPKNYAEPPRFRYSRSYEVHENIFFFTILLLLMALIVITFNNKLSGEIDIISAGLVCITFCVGFLYLFKKDNDWIKDYATVRKDAPGSNPTKARYPQNFENTNLYWSSIMKYWCWLLSILGCGIFIYLAIYYQVWFNFQPWFKNAVLFAFWTITIIGLIVRYIIQKKVIPNCKKALDKMNDINQMEHDKCVMQLMTAENFLNKFQGFSLLIIALVWLAIILFMGIGFISSI